MKTESFEKVKESYEKSVHELDIFHQKFKDETWEDGQKLELLIDLENFD